jgi:hypothetical protein
VAKALLDKGNLARAKRCGFRSPVRSKYGHASLAGKIQLPFVDEELLKCPVAREGRIPFLQFFAEAGLKPLHLLSKNSERNLNLARDVTDLGT